MAIHDRCACAERASCINPDGECPLIDPSWRTDSLSEAIDRLAASVEALTRHAEMSDKILARCESHLAQEGRWTASAVTALTLAHSIASAPPVQSHRPSRVVRSRVEPPDDSLAIGLLCQLSSDAARLTGTDELSTADVSLSLDIDLQFTPLRSRMHRHAPCAHTTLATCVPMLRWLATGIPVLGRERTGRYALIVAGDATADDLLAEYDAATLAAQDAAAAQAVTWRPLAEYVAARDAAQAVTA